VVDEINRQSFGTQTRTSDVSAKVHEMTGVIKEKLCAAIENFRLDLIIAENSVTIPLNIPLGLAIVETVMETGIGCIAHHHDFVWERERFMVNAVDDFLHAAFPPPLAQMQHVVINSRAGREFSRRSGLPSYVIPNIMDFDNPPGPPDEYSRDFRETIGLQSDDILILQPTRVIQRKGIEHSIELVRQLDDPRCKLVITHASGDEGDAYAERVRRFADLMGVHVIFADRYVSHVRGTREDGQKCYTVWDAYQDADFITYPSLVEGFGNAFLEAVYFKKPILCNRYSIYRTDIEPLGFKVVLMDGFLTDEVVRQVRGVLTNKPHRQEIIEHNYAVARQFFSYARAETELRAILAEPVLAPSVFV
jgi:glycosyltransferase involved in cell wall biosynthesis